MNSNRIKTILVVDDDQDWRDFASTALSSDYSLQVATNGDDGFKLAEKNKPDLILLDVMMPGGMDGFTTLCKLKQNPKLATTPIIMLSEINSIMQTSFDKEILEEYLKQGPSVFLEKPVTPQVLIATVQELLDN